MPAFVNDTRSNSPAAARHPPHLANDLIDLRYDINSEGRDAGIEGAVRIWHATCVAELIDDIWVRSVAAGAFEVGLGGVQPDDRTTPLRERRGYNTRATADVQHPVARLDPGKIEEWTRQAPAPSRHEVLVGLGIGRQERGHRDGHFRPRLFGFPLVWTGSA